MFGFSNMGSSAQDMGDDLVYIRASIGSTQTIVTKTLCSRSWQYPASYWGPEASHEVYVSRNNQTVWSGPGGVRTN